MATKSLEKNHSITKQHINTVLTEYAKINNPPEHDVKVVFGDYNAIDEVLPSLGLASGARRGDMYVDKYFGVWTYNPIRNIQNHYKGGRFQFIDGSIEPQPNDQIHGATSTADCFVQSVELTSGSWALGTAEGVIYFEIINGFFVDDEDIKNTGDITILTMVDSPSFIAEFILSEFDDIFNITTGVTITGQTSGAQFLVVSDAVDVSISMDSSGNPGLILERMIVELRSVNQTAFAVNNELLTCSFSPTGTVTYKKATLRPLSDVIDIYGEPFYYVFEIDAPATPVNIGAVYSDEDGYEFEVIQKAGSTILYCFFRNSITYWSSIRWDIGARAIGAEFTRVSGVGPDTFTLAVAFSGLPDNTIAYQSNFFISNYLFNHVTGLKTDFTMLFPGSSVIIRMIDYTNTQFESMITAFGADVTVAQMSFYRLSASEDGIEWNIIADSKVQDLSSNALTHLLTHPKPDSNFKYLKIENTGNDFSANSPSDDVSLKIGGLTFTYSQIDEGEETDFAWEIIKPQEWFGHQVISPDPDIVNYNNIADPGFKVLNPRTFTFAVPFEGWYSVDNFLYISDWTYLPPPDSIWYRLPTGNPDLLEVQGNSTEGFITIDVSGYQGAGIGITTSWRHGSLQGSKLVYVDSNKLITLRHTRNNGSATHLLSGYMSATFLGKIIPGSQTE